MRRRELISAVRVALFVAIAVLLQTLVLSHLTIMGVMADLFLVLTVLVGLSRGSLGGAIFGFCAGLVHDIAYFQPLGTHALLFVLVGYFAGMFLVRFQTVNLWAIFLITLVASFATQLGFGIFQYITGPRSAFFTLVGTQMIPGALFDALIAVPIYSLLTRLRVLSPPGRGKASAGSGGE